MLQKQRSKLSSKIRAEASEATAGLERKSKEARAMTSDVYSKYRDQTSVFRKKLQALSKQLNALVPGPRRQSFVWLYERL